MSAESPAGEAWRAAHRAGAAACRKWRAEGWPERDCVAAAVAAGVMAHEAVAHPAADQRDPA